MTDKEFQYMKEAVSAELAELLSNDFGMTITETLDTLYGSETYVKLCNPNTDCISKAHNIYTPF